MISAEGEGRAELTLGKYNRTRGDHPDLVKVMSAMMERNICLSSSHPLLAAVDKTLIDIAALSDYDPSKSTKEDLKVATFPNAASPPVIILNGQLRVLAAQAAFEALSSQQRKLEAQVEELQNRLDGPEQRAATAVHHRARAKLDQAKEDLRNVQQTLKNIQFWPVYFYDEGLITP